MARVYIMSLLFIILYGPVLVKAQSLVLTPKWTAQAQFAGYYAAEKMGFYKEAGVDVKVVHPAISESSFSVLQKGDSQLAVMNLSFALTAYASGVKIVNVMQTSQVNSLMLVTRKPFKDISSLKHQKIAVWNHLSQELLDRLSRHYDLDVEWIRFNSGINVFLSGAVDICLVGSYNEYIQLAECGLNVDPANLFRFSDYGYNLPEDGLYVTEEFYDRHPDLIRKVVQASVKGWEWVNEHPKEALDIVMEQVRLNNIGTNRYHQQKMLEEVLRLQMDRQTGKRTYHLGKEGFEGAVRNLLHESEIRAIHYKDFVK